MKRTLLAVLLLALLQSGPAMAQTADEEEGRGVARISILNGDVSVRRSDTGDWVAAAVNAPVIVPDTVYSGASSRAEVQLDYANMIRLAANTEVRFTELEYRRYQLQIAQGTVTYSVLRDSNADVDLSTPNVSVRPYRKGRYRITVTPEGTTEVTVRDGAAEIYTPNGVESLGEGKTMLIRGSASNPEFRTASAIPRDDWDRWNSERDKELRQTSSYQYVSNDVYGVEDLDGYGSWVNVDPYGWVWSPRATVGWAPYRYGRWSWVDWYGWSWVSYDPWGWAPYHYGRWFHHGGRWCWWPGAMHGRHYWRPALVGFLGWNSYSGFNVGVGFGFGHVGWVPLAPYETYHPWYGRHYYGSYRNRTHIDNSVNIVNNVNVTNIYRNARVDNGITAVRGDNFGRGRVDNVYRANGAEFRNASAVRGQLPVTPHRDSVRMASREVGGTPSRSARSADSFYTRRSARPVERVSFADQQRSVQASSQRTFERMSAATGDRDATSRSAGRTSAATGTSAQRQSARTATRSGTAAGRAATSSTSGRVETGRTAETTSPRTATTRTQRSASQDTGTSGTTSASGWRRFGEPRSTGQATGRTSTRTTGTSQSGVTSRSTSRQSGTATTRPQSTGSSGWQRFGEPTRSAAGASTRSATPSRSPSSATRSSQGSGSAPRASGNSGWSSFGSSRSATGGSRESSVRSSQGSTVQSGRSSSPSYQSNRSRSTTGAQRNSSSNAVRVQPPVVHQRGTPSNRSGSSSSRTVSPSSSRSSGSVFGGSSRSRSTINSGSSSPSRSSGSVFGGSSRSSGSVFGGSSPSRSRSSGSVFGGSSRSQSSSGASRSSGGSFGRSSSGASRSSAGSSRSSGSSGGGGRRR